jgi:hypothetical protein
MFKVGSQVGIQNGRLFNGHGVVDAYVNVGAKRRKFIPASWKGANGEWVLVQCADGKTRRYSNGDITKVVSLEGKTKEELKAFGIGTTLQVGGVTLRALDGAEIYKKEDGSIEVTAPQGSTVRLSVEQPYQERGSGVVSDPTDDETEEE